MEIVMVFLFIGLALALATNEIADIQEARNGFDGDDDFDY